MSFAGLLELCAVAAVGFAAATTLACALVYPLLRPWLLRCQPAARARLITTMAGAPILSGATFTSLALVPSLMTAAGLLADHCAEPGHIHLHLCVLHPPAWVGHTMPWVLFGLVLALAIRAFTTVAAGCVEATRIERDLRAISRPAALLDARVVASDVPLSVTVGLWRPTVFLSSGLLRSLPHPFLEVVLAHERGHVARSDLLRSLIVSALSWVHLPWTSRLLLADLALAHEEACDDLAVDAVGSRVVVADAILAVERLLGGMTPVPLAAAFTGGMISTRVERLLQDPTEEPHGAGGAFGAALVVVLGAVTLMPVHHLTEALLNFVLAA
jgi:Zn-dependent protease with chaperone function